jgi:hypothetical protein
MPAEAASRQPVTSPSARHCEYLRKGPSAIRAGQTASTRQRLPAAVTYVIVCADDGNDYLQMGVGNDAVFTQDGSNLALAGARDMAIGPVGRQLETMLILDAAQLVVLEMPKTATQALRRTLKPYVRELNDARRHGGFGYFKRNYYPDLAKEWDGPVECCCVVREPLARTQSWYRYRQRENIAATENSTAGIGFDEFVEALLSEAPPPFAVIGRQAAFTRWNGTRAKVDHIFDYQTIDLLLSFLGARLGAQLRLPRRNESAGPMPEPLPPQLQARFADAYAEDYALYHAVQKAGGHLQRGATRRRRSRAAKRNR